MREEGNSAKPGPRAHVDAFIHDGPEWPGTEGEYDDGHTKTEPGKRMTQDAGEAKEEP